MGKNQFALLLAVLLGLVAAVLVVGFIAPQPEIKCPPVFMEGGDVGGEPMQATTGTGFTEIGRYQEIQIDGDSDQKAALLVDQAGTGPALSIVDDGTVSTSFMADGTVDSLGYMLLNGTEGQVLVTSTEAVTGTAVVAHGLTTVTWAQCVMGQAAKTGAGECALATVDVSANVVTAKTWQDDWTTAATETDCVVYCLVVGTP